MKQTITKGVQVYAWPGGKGKPLGILLQIKIRKFYQLIYAQT